MNFCYMLLAGEMQVEHNKCAKQLTKLTSDLIARCDHFVALEELCHFVGFVNVVGLSSVKTQSLQYFITFDHSCVLNSSYFILRLPTNLQQ